MESRFYVADAHCDFLYFMVNAGWNIRCSTANQAIALPHMLAGNTALQFFAAWVDADAKTSCLQQCLDLIDAYDRMLDENSVLQPLTPDFDPAGGKIATVLTVEGGEAIHGSLENLRLFHRLGVRAMTLTWNHSNELASPAMRHTNKGLTKLGRSVVQEMNRIGMAVDTAHLSDAGIDELLELSTAPIFSSHTNAREILLHKRSLKDAHIRAIGEQGGVVCVNYYPPQLCREEAGIDDIVRHIAHVANVGGIDHVALGSDFDGMVHYPREIRSSADVPKILLAMKAHGFSDSEIKKIAYDNLHDYIVQFCK